MPRGLRLKKSGAEDAEVQRPLLVKRGNKARHAGAVTQGESGRNQKHPLLRLTGKAPFHDRKGPSSQSSLSALSITGIERLAQYLI